MQLELYILTRLCLPRGVKADEGLRLFFSDSRNGGMGRRITYQTREALETGVGLFLFRLAWQPACLVWAKLLPDTIKDCSPADSCNRYWNPSPCVLYQCTNTVMS